MGQWLMSSCRVLSDQLRDPGSWRGGAVPQVKRSNSSLGLEYNSRAFGHGACSIGTLGLNAAYQTVPSSGNWPSEWLGGR